MPHLTPLPRRRRPSNRAAIGPTIYKGGAMQQGSFGCVPAFLPSFYRGAYRAAAAIRPYCDRRTHVTAAVKSPCHGRHTAGRTADRRNFQRKTKRRAAFKQPSIPKPAENKRPPQPDSLRHTPFPIRAAASRHFYMFFFLSKPCRFRKIYISLSDTPPFRLS